MNGVTQELKFNFVKNVLNCLINDSTQEIIVKSEKIYLKLKIMLN